MTLTNSTKLSIQTAYGEVPEAAIVEPGANLIEAVPVTINAALLADSPDWTYSATASDAGTAGVLDGQPGLTYSGPGTNHFRVQVTDFDVVEHGITAPEATDTSVMILAVNSEIAAFSDEGFTTVAAEIAVEHNVDTIITLDAGDVLRVGVQFTGEANGDLDLAPGSINIT